jgi:hypothetical protein
MAEQSDWRPESVVNGRMFGLPAAWTRPLLAMYLVIMEQATREHIAAAAAAHQELGREYEAPVAESLVERIGAEIDRRVEAKLAEKGNGRRRPADLAPADRHRGLWLGIGIGSAATGISALIAANVINGPVNSVLHQSVQHVIGATYYNVAGDMLAWLVGVWGLLLVIYIVYAWRRNIRSRE